MKKAIVEMKGIKKNFFGIQALKGVDFSVNEGEIHALIGENGAGKSTLMKVLLGMFTLDSGEILLDGKPYKPDKPLDALRSGISMIHQEINLVHTTSVAENIWLGREELFKRGLLINKSKMLKETQKLFDNLQINLNPKALVQKLGIADMQLAEIARAASYDSKIVIMDEPTSALSEREIKRLFKTIKDMKARGVSTIFISHKLEEVLEVCDRVTVFRDGNFITTLDAEKENITKKQLVSLMVGRDIEQLFPKEHAKIGEVVLEARNLCSGHLCRNVSLSVREGEILGICGLMGAGRTEIMRAIFGIDKLTSGSVYLRGRKLNIRKPRDAIRQGICMLTEDRLRLGVFHRLTVRENLSVSYIYRLGKSFFVDSKLENSNAEAIVKKMSVKCAGINQNIAGLSGGNQQKVVIGRWLLAEPKVLILDEPTRGIDVGSKAEIYKLISQLAAQGFAIIMVSSEMPEIMGLCDRVLVVRGGTIVYEGNIDEVDTEMLLQHAFGI